MTEQEYADITAACDRLLRGPGTSLARLAISALHVLNEHPGSLAQYAPLFNATTGGDSVEPWYAFADTPRAAIRALRGFGRSLASTSQMPMGNEPLGRIDAIIVSHLSNPAQLDEENDFYFGALQSLLRERGITSLLVLVNHLPPSHARRARTTQSFPSPRILLPRAVTLAEEADIWRQCASAHKSLRRQARSARNSLDSGVALLASRDALSASTAANLRLHAALSNICRALNPKLVVTTYEGDAAERLVWQAARAARHRPLCVGYQHTRLLKLSHAIRRRVSAPGTDCDPDAVLTLGESPHAALAASPGLGSVRLIRYGSHRHAAPTDLPQPQYRPRRCLVLPDADDRECSALFDFALACARRRPDISFALRPHPIVDTRSLLRRHETLQRLPDNVSLSVNKPLAQEFAQARYCLYRGSSAALHAVLAGIKPFYLARPGELPFDPLFELTDWRETVTSPDDLTTRMSAADGSQGSAAASLATSLCERYVSPVRPAAIDELLQMVTQ